jgi:uroporphyrin-III C-methyltransferase
MKDENPRGILVVGHGSRRTEANEDVREVTRAISRRTGFKLVEPAFLEIEHPNIAEGLARLVQRGACDITVHPYFLSPGRHTRGDIPVEVAAAARRFPGINYRISEPLSAHHLVIEASIERILDSMKQQVPAHDENFHRLPQRFTAVAGRVYLVGAGPGDPGLLTIKALSLLRSCEVVIYDSLINQELLTYAHASARRIYVGKVSDERQRASQRQINTLLIQHARAGRRVVRLKGGDPFLFGRGGEEAQALVEAGIRFEVVPGISSALAVPAYAGIPLTHRGIASSVLVITGARSFDGDYRPGAFQQSASADTVVVLMGLAHLKEIATDLLNCGRSLETPAAVISCGTYHVQETVTATLGTIAQEVENAGLRTPAVIIVGEVVRLRERLDWFEHLGAVSEESPQDTLAVAC